MCQTRRVLVVSQTMWGLCRPRPIGMHGHNRLRGQLRHVRDVPRPEMVRRGDGGKRVAERVGGAWGAGEALVLCVRQAGSARCARNESTAVAVPQLINALLCVIQGFRARHLNPLGASLSTLRTSSSSSNAHRHPTRALRKRCTRGAVGSRVHRVHSRMPAACSASAGLSQCCSADNPTLYGLAAMNGWGEPRASAFPLNSITSTALA